MNQYYLEKNGKQIGPFRLEEMKRKNLKSDMLAWHDGLENWRKIKDIPELNDIVNKLPPPIPKSNEPNFSENRDHINVEAIAAGAIIIVLNFSVYLFLRSNPSGISQGDAPETFLTIALIARIFIAYWCIVIAKAKNRNKFLWGILALGLPPIALIIIGLLKDKNTSQLIKLPEQTKNPNNEYLIWKDKNPGKSLNDFYRENNK